MLSCKRIHFFIFITTSTQLNGDFIARAEETTHHLNMEYKNAIISLSIFINVDSSIKCNTRYLLMNYLCRRSESRLFTGAFILSVFDFPYVISVIASVERRLFPSAMTSRRASSTRPKRSPWTWL